MDDSHLRELHKRAGQPLNDRGRAELLLCAPDARAKLLPQPSG